MPGIPVVARETSCSRSSDQMCRLDSRGHLSAEEELAAEESLAVYCKPVEFYNILQRRAISNPSFLQRCLHYRIKARHKRRIQMTILLSRTVTETQTVFPLYIFLARLVSDVGAAEYSAIYSISRLCMFRNCPGIDGNSQVQANFTLPEVSKLAVEAKSSTLAILFISSVENLNSSIGDSTSMVPLDLTSFASKAEGYCLYGKVSLESLYMTWESSPNFNLGQRAEIMSTVDFLPCFLKSEFLNEDKRVSIQVPCNSENVRMSKQIQISVSAEEFGAKEKSHYYTFAGSEVPSSSLSHITRLREGNVIFNYRYYQNKLQRTEVTEDFSCPFCLVKCASFKGLKCHLPASHDLFSFEFWQSDEFLAVNVSVKTDIWRSETGTLGGSRRTYVTEEIGKKLLDQFNGLILSLHLDLENLLWDAFFRQMIADGVDPKLQTFVFCVKPLKRRRPKSLASKHENRVRSLLVGSDFPAEDELLEKADGVSSVMGHLHPDPYIQSVSENNLGTSAVLQFAKTRKISVELSDPRNCALVRKRQFFHSHRAQPMALEQVLSDQDSEDEVDDDVADFEDRRMLDNFVDVTKDEKQIMHMWNSFVRKQRVIADGHIPWACEAFSKLHAPELVRSTSLAWSWRFFLIKLWNHVLLDARTMNECNLILERYRKENSDPNI